MTDAAPTRERTPQYQALLLVGIVLPALLAGANHFVLDFVSHAQLSTALTVAVFLFYIGQVGSVSWAAGRYIANWPLRWCIYFWSMLLIDLQLLVLLMEDRQHEVLLPLGTSLIAGQLGMVTVWGMLGGGNWELRIPAWLVLAPVYLFFAAMVANARFVEFSWGEIATLQTVVLSLTCLVLRWLGFTLSVVAPSSFPPWDEETVENARPRRLRQFGIRDVLIGTTVLAILLGAAKAGDMLRLEFVKEFFDSAFPFVIVIAGASSAISIVAVWAAVGQGRWFWRSTLALSVPLAIGFMLSRYCLELQRLVRGNKPFSYRFYWAEIGDWWIGWAFLNGALLAASMLVFRALGYRLVRVVPVVESAATGVAVLPQSHDA